MSFCKPSTQARLKRMGPGLYVSMRFRLGSAFVTERAGRVPAYGAAHEGSLNDAGACLRSFQSAGEVHSTAALSASPRKQTVKSALTVEPGCDDQAWLLPRASNCSIIAGHGRFLSCQRRASCLHCSCLSSTDTNISTSRSDAE
jgi:hypothetical protein